VSHRRGGGPYQGSHPGGFLFKTRHRIGFHLEIVRMIRHFSFPSSNCFARTKFLHIAIILFFSAILPAQSLSPDSLHFYFVDCSGTLNGDGSSLHPWNNLDAAAEHPFTAGDRIALARGTSCHGSFSPRGSGSNGNPIRLTAYGKGARPRIIATDKDRQALGLFNQEYWQIDSLDIAGGNKYGIFVSGDNGWLHHIYLKNLFVHDVIGGELKNKDNGLVLVGPSSPTVFFDDVLVDGVIAAHTNQWAGILIGGGPFGYATDAPLNKHIIIRNSSVQDVYGDGIVLFRDADSVIETSTAWQTGMQPTQTIGTPNAIWTWTCTDCTVRDNEAFLTDSPGVDGGAYDIDWNNTRNTVERNYGHDTQGYCFAAFAAGYVTGDSAVLDNLCVNNGMSPRLAALQGAIYLHGWNGGVLRNLRLERNTILWNPPVATAAAIVNDATIEGAPILFNDNAIDSFAPLFYSSNAQFSPSANTYRYQGGGEARFTLGNKMSVTLSQLQQAGLEKGSSLQKEIPSARTEISLRLEATVKFDFDEDGLLAPGPRAQLMVLRSLSMQYGPSVVTVIVRLCGESSVPDQKIEETNALGDLDAGSIRFEHDGKEAGLIQLLSSDGRLLAVWHGFQNAASLGGAVRARIGAPRYAGMIQTVQAGER
jgi:hypothetical protein